MPNSITFIGASSFNASTTFIGTKGSYAEEYAIKKDINFIDINVFKMPESITVKDITLIENYDKDGSSNGNYFHYNVKPQYITVKFEDGTVISGDYMSVQSKVYDKTGFNIEYNDDQSYENPWGVSYENPWGVGKHTAVVLFLGLVSEYTVEVIETPIENIEVTYKKDYLTENEDISMANYFNNGDYSDFHSWCNRREYINGVEIKSNDVSNENPISSQRKVSYYYPVCDNLIDKVTVHFKPGYENSEYAQFTEYAIETEQIPKKPWDAGTHSFTVSSYGYSQSFDFDIVKQSNPVVDISLTEPIKIFQYTNGVFCDLYYTGKSDIEKSTIFRYEIENLNPVISITYADGSKLTNTLTEIYKKTGIKPMFYTNQQYGDSNLPNNLWNIGKHVAMLHYGSFTKQVDVEIVKNPVERIFIINQPKYDFYGLYTAVIMLQYTDGRYENIKLKRITDNKNFYEYNNYYSEVLKHDILAITTSPKSGRYIVRIGNKAVSLVSTQKDIVALNIDEEYGQLSLFIDYSDGTNEKHYVTNLDVRSNGGSGNHASCFIETDKAAFNGALDTNDGYNLSITLYNGTEEVNGVKSNIIEKSEWYRCYLTACNRILNLFDSFYGELNESNIDAIITNAIQTYQEGNYIYDRTIFDGNSIRASIKNIFGIDNADLSLSKLYSPVSDKYFYINFFQDSKIISIEKAGNQWKVKAKSDEGYLYLTLDNELHTNKYSCKETECGDVNGDGEIDGRDVINTCSYLADYDFDTGSSGVEIKDGADANNDGTVDGRDVIMLCSYLANYDYDTGSSDVVLG